MKYIFFCFLFCAMVNCKDLKQNDYKENDSARMVSQPVFGDIDTSKFDFFQNLDIRNLKGKNPCSYFEIKYPAVAIEKKNPSNIHFYLSKNYVIKWTLLNFENKFKYIIHYKGYNKETKSILFRYLVFYNGSIFNFVSSDLLTYKNEMADISMIRKIDVDEGHFTSNGFLRSYGRVGIRLKDIFDFDSSKLEKYFTDGFIEEARLSSKGKIIEKPMVIINYATKNKDSIPNSGSISILDSYSNCIYFFIEKIGNSK